MPDRAEGPAPLSDTVVDTSAAVALLTGATIGGEVAHTMATADRVLISTATVVELGIVLESRLGPVGAAVLDRFLRAGQVEVIA